MYEKFMELLNLSGSSTAEVSRRTGIGKSTFSNWKKGEYNPKIDKLQKIATYFGVGVEYFFTDDYEERMKLYRHELNSPVYEVSAGQGRENGDYATEYEKIDEEDMTEGYEWCSVHGDSMFPELKDGDRVKVRLQTETEKTDLTVVKVDGEHCTVKYVEIVENGVWLRALNKDVFEDRFYSVQEVITLPIKVIGKVTEVRRQY